MKLSVTKLRSGGYWVRPEGSLGTCGWSPKAWTVSYVRRNDPIGSFLEANNLWSREEITGLVYDS